MKEYSVAVPILGTALVVVGADSEAEAIEQALGLASPDHVDEWMTHERLVEGNVFYGQINKVRIDDVYDPEEDEDDDAN